MEKPTVKPQAHDVAIVGAGMAGLTAAIYCQRFKLTTIVLAKEPGGVINESHLVENWPGVESIKGIELMERVLKQAQALGATFIFDEVNAINGGSGIYELTTAGGQSARAAALIIAIGCERRKLGVPGEKEFTGKGVSYCATCDAFFFKGKTVAVIGGSDSAVGSAELLSAFAEKVYIVYRRDRLRAEPLRVDRALANAKIEVIYESWPESILGKETVTAVDLNDGRTLAVAGVFVEIGFDPSRKIAEQLGIELDESGFVKVDEGCHTNVEGVFAAGDVTTGSDKIRQLVTAAAEGAIAAENIYEYIKRRPLEL